MRKPFVWGNTFIGQKRAVRKAIPLLHLLDSRLHLRGPPHATKSVHASAERKEAHTINK